MPSFNNISYINISKGNYFGEIDITGSAQTKNFDQKDWYFNKSLIYRHFSVRSQTNSDVLVLSIKDLHKMEIEFVDIYEDMLANSIKILQKAMILKLNTIKKCTEQLMKLNNSQDSYDLSSSRSKSAEFEIEAVELDKIIEDIDKTPSEDQSDISESLRSDIDS